jgi:hypothetical protein
MCVLFAVSALAACAAADPQVASKDPSPCPLEYRTGTNIPIRNCTVLTDEEKRQQRDSAEDVHMWSKTNGALQGPGGG